MSTTDTRTADELAEAIRDGDTTITSAQVAEARHREEYDQLTAEARVRAEQHTAETAREQAIQALRADLDATPNSVNHLTELADRATAALSELVTALQNREHSIRAARTRARELGIAEMDTDHQPRDPSGIGWRRDRTMLVLDDRTITTVEPGRMLGSITADVRKAHRLPDRPAGAVRKSSDHTPVRALLDGLDNVPPPPEPADVLVTYRQGRNAGLAEYVTRSRAEHMLMRGIAHRTTSDERPILV